MQRHVPSFTGESFISEKDEYKVILLRTVKTVVHELGHLFGIKHCMHYDCVMNVEYCMEVTLDSTLDFCPVCYQKILHCIGFDHVERYKKLTEVCVQFGSFFSSLEKEFEEKHDIIEDTLKAMKQE